MTLHLISKKSPSSVCYQTAGFISLLGFHHFSNWVTSQSESVLIRPDAVMSDDTKSRSPRLRQWTLSLLHLSSYLTSAEQQQEQTPQTLHTSLSPHHTILTVDNLNWLSVNQAPTTHVDPEVKQLLKRVPRSPSSPPPKTKHVVSATKHYRCQTRQLRITRVCAPAWSASAGRCSGSSGVCGTAWESGVASCEESREGTSWGSHRVSQTLTAFSVSEGWNQDLHNFPGGFYSSWRPRVIP